MIRSVTLATPYPWQAEFLEDDHRFKFAFVGRRAGKSEGVLIAALTGHGPDRCFKGALQGGEILWVFPSSTVIRRTHAWERLKAATKAVWVKKSEIAMSVILPGGGSVSILSGENPDSLRGGDATGIVFDETKDHHPQAWASVESSLMDREGWGIIVGTPGVSGDWSHELWEKVASDPVWRRWQLPTSVKPSARLEELERLRRSMGSAVFAREHEAQFINVGGSMFRREWLRRYRRDDQGLLHVGKDKVLEAGLQRFAVADLAATAKTWSDWSVVALFGVDGARRIYVLDVDRRKAEGHELLPMLRRAAQRCNAVFVESTAYHNALIGIARADGLPVREIKADKDKVTRFELAVAAGEAGRVWLPEGAPWAEVFATEVCEFPEGRHDDQCDVLAHACRIALPGPTNPPPRQPRNRDPFWQAFGDRQEWDAGYVGEW